MNPDVYKKRYEDFGVSRFKVLGGIQIGLGSICSIVSIIGVGIGSTDISKPCTTRYYDSYYSYSYIYSGAHSSYSSCYYDIYFAFDVVCLILSGWIIMTGCLPFCMTETKVEKWTCLKTAFMVCSILGSVIFIPTILGLGTTGAIIRAFDGQNDTWKAAFPSILAVLSFIEFVVAIASASYCCCCWESKTRVYPIIVNETGQPFVVLKDWQWAELSAHNQVTDDHTMTPLPVQGTNFRQLIQGVPMIPHQHVNHHQQVSQQPNQYSTTQHVPQQPNQYSTTQHVPQQPNQYYTTQHAPQQPSQYSTVQHVTQQPNQYSTMQHVTQQPNQYSTTQHVTQQPNQYYTIQHALQQPSQYSTMQHVTQQPSQYSSMETNQQNLTFHPGHLNPLPNRSASQGQQSDVAYNDN